MEQKIIKYVANYLRKSRGESEADLIKHQTELQELCHKNNWKYVEYKEIESGDSILLRPVFQQLLEDVENELYDAVGVVDIDRLGRGDMGDQDRIKKTFLKSDTWVVTPQYVYNLNNENDEFTVDMRSFIARMEYKQIVKRLVRGKRIGSKLGQWTNGVPPLPYDYQKYIEKKLTVNPEKNKLYQRIKQEFLYEHKKTNQIAWDLNKEGIPSPRGKQWSNKVIRDILKDETHLGRIVSNKTKGDAHKKKQKTKSVVHIPSDQWIRVENCHEAVKTLDEHEQIIALFYEYNLNKAKTKHDPHYEFTGLIKCSICKRTMQVYPMKTKNKTLAVKPCWYKDPLGNKCPNHGGLISLVESELKFQRQQYKERLIRQIEYGEVIDVKVLKNEISGLQTKVIEIEKRIEFIYEQYEKKIYNEDMFIARRTKAENEILEVNRIIDVKNKQIQNSILDSPVNRLKKFQELEDLLDVSNLPEERNQILKRMIKSIVWLVYTENDVIKNKIEITFH